MFLLFVHAKKNCSKVKKGNVKSFVRYHAKVIINILSRGYASKG